jgi:ribose 5-phosphate isomerase A
MTQDEAKWAVAHRAVEFVDDGMRVGLGTGTTSTMFIHALAERVRNGLKIRCVASSAASHALGQSLGMEVVTLTELPELDLYIDGADEVMRSADGSLNLIKGGGAALLREKIVASAAQRFLVVADSTKLVRQLGKFPLPVEVVKMALPVVEPQLAVLGLKPRLRLVKGGSDPLHTDEDNYILDCMAGLIADPEETARAIRGIVGVVEHGLFLKMASLALIAGDEGVLELQAGLVP